MNKNIKRGNTTNTYLIKMYYMNKNINKYEYQVQETIYFGDDDTIENEVLKYNERIKKNFNYNVEQYSIYKHVKSVSLKSEVLKNAK